MRDLKGNKDVYGAKKLVPMTRVLHGCGRVETCVCILSSTNRCVEGSEGERRSKVERLK